MANEGAIRLPVTERDPLRRIASRLLAAVLFLFIAATVIWMTPGYTDEVDGNVSFGDAFYFATVSLSTTGYGDIVPVTPEARLVHTIVITPLRILFLLVLIGATVEALATSTREQIRINRWRKSLHQHTVVIGYGVKGRSAVTSLIDNGVDPNSIVIVDGDRLAVSEANDKGLTAILGDATREDVLNRADISRAARVVVTTDRDDTSILATLTARQLNPAAEISVAMREAANVNIARQGGANTVVPSSDAVGRILGLATVSPPLGHMLEDLISTGTGLEVTEREVSAREEGRAPKQIDDVVLAVLRDGDMLPYHSPAIGHLLRGDRIIVVRPSEDLPWAVPSPDARPSEDTDDEDDEMI
jgi:voltage-gated potassium channel